MGWNKENAAAQLGLALNTYIKIVKTFFVEKEVFITKINACLNVNDFEGIKCVAHEVKGVAANFRIEDIRELAEKLEVAVKAGSGQDEIRRIITILEKTFSDLAQSID